MTQGLILQIRTAIMAAGVTALAVIALWYLCGSRILAAVKSWSAEMRILMLVAVAGLSYFAVSKHALTITWDDYILNDGSAYNTNTYAQINFKWRCTAAAMPSDTPLYISKRLANFGSSWELAATTTVGANAHTLDLADATNYNYYVWHEWTPPSPVHTNSVWLGTVIEKARHAKSVDKMVIVNGYIQKNGVKIAPKKEGE